MRVIITGCAGFIGSNLTNYLHNQRYTIFGVDSETYAADYNRIKHIVEADNNNYAKEDIVTFPWADEIDRTKPDAIIHLAAESHVDNSIKNPENFIHSNILGTKAILDGVRKSKKKPWILSFSTDETYGELALQPEDGRTTPFVEKDKLSPNSPYSWSKASADLLCKAYRRTYNDFSITILKPTNNYGPNQHLEKFLPTIIKNILNKTPIPVYGSGANVREWIAVSDLCKIVDLLIKKWKVEPDKVENRIFNIGSGILKSNLEMVRIISALMNAPPNCYEFVQDRPGHDKKYAVNCDKINRLLKPGPRTPLEKELKVVIEDVKKRLGK